MKKKRRVLCRIMSILSSTL